MGDLWQQMAETAGTDEAEAARRAEEAEAAKKVERDLPFEKQLSLLETAEERQQEMQQQKQSGTLLLPLELQRKLKRSLKEWPFSARCLILVRRLQFLQQLASQRLPLKRRLLRLGDDGAPSAVEAAASEAAAMGDCCNRWQWPLSPMRQSSPRG